MSGALSVDVGPTRARGVGERRGVVPGQGSMWVFVIGDFWIFLCYFATYAWDRGPLNAMFTAGQGRLSTGLGVLNTVILLTSSLFVAGAVAAVRAGRREAAQSLLLAGFICGAAFLAVKAVEWIPHLRAGESPGTSEWWLYYYSLTGLHVIHVGIGMGLLLYVRGRLRALPAAAWEDPAAMLPATGLDDTAPLTPGPLHLAQTGASFWHMVDLLWIVIFALIYLVR